MAQQTKALTVAAKAQEALDSTQLDPRLLMVAKAMQLMSGQDRDGNPNITGDLAIAAALYQAGTGQMLGRDFYVNEKVGRMEGYRGVARDANERGVGEVQIKYRPLTAEEATDHEIEAGDTAVACEVYQLRAWNVCQRMGQRYEPIVGIGVIRKVEKYDKKSTQKWNDNERRYVQLPESGWRLQTLEGGMTWRKKAQNRAYKDALRHTPGMPASPEEVITEAAMTLDELPPEAARLDMAQAMAWVAEHGAAGDDEPDGVTEGEFTEQPKPAQATNGQQADPPGFSVWADWTHVDHAIAWGLSQGVFSHENHARNAYAKCKTECKPVNHKAMWQCWWEDVMRRVDEAAVKAASEAAGQDAEWAAIDAAGVQEAAPF